MRWSDVNDIASEPEQADVHVLRPRFTALHRWRRALDGFDDDPDKSSQRILRRFRWSGSTNASIRA